MHVCGGGGWGVGDHNEDLQFSAKERKYLGQTPGSHEAVTHTGS